MTDIFDKMTLDDEIEFKLAQADSKTLREANFDLVSRMNSLADKIEENEKAVTKHEDAMIALLQKYAKQDA